MLEKDARDAIIVALDCDRERSLELADALHGRGVWVKVGMTLFYRYGPAIVDEMRDRELKVFLDLKLHDIPFQVRGAAHSAALSGADMLSLHALGGNDMVMAAREGVEEAAAELGEERARLLAISILTSMDSAALTSIGISCSIEDEVSRLAKLAVGAGSDGIVCSPQEAASMRKLLGDEALIVTPGVRPTGAAIGDQARVATPGAALRAGASKLVIGRPITHADSPVAALETIVQELIAV